MGMDHRKDGTEPNCSATYMKGGLSMNTKLVDLAIAQLTTLEKFVEDADNSDGLNAIIDNIKSTLALIQSEK